MFVYLDRGVLPDAICLVLRQRGRKRVPRSIDISSPDGNTRLRMNWTVIELWSIPAQSLLDMDDVGVVPLIPLSDVGDSLQPILHRCRKIIDERAPANEHENLIVATAILAGLRYTEADVFPLFGDRKMIFESPLLKEAAEELREEARKEGRQEGRQEGLQAAIVRLLKKHFPEIPERIRTRVTELHDESRLEELLDKASDCTDLAEFEAELN